ncbi:glycoside hydrolase family 29 protein [Botryobasidium botryosum FD-172 SS1]|uniref:alpha-L-fucosidase n=1 Tax=Botryobasidium botryosum (strain FD-172 SS1) TaxID=930990 RepID=A0A067N088_BOTB1|nr:glycoside hydrolase family 29 protein [Botryobasidium botryosum FD-172 SS1]
MPADEVRVKVWVVPPGPGAWTQTQTQAQAQAQAQGQSGAAGGIVSVVDSDGRVILRAPRAGGSDGDEHLAHAPDPYTAKRDTPEWWDDAKFGIFIHWGIYSVPAWNSQRHRYEPFLRWWLHNDGKSETWRYHLFFLKSLLGEYWRYHRDTYGEDFVYDDFIPDFTARKFNASQWVELFADAGARYFVFVTKHHDGYALFDTGNSTHRSSYHLGPKRDFLRELFNAARAEQPSLHRGTYYSMPEWFNPDAGPYGFGNWPGHLARNPYDESKVEPYTGRLEGKDYLEDIQLAHMRSLAMDYESEIMWCDIGGPNLTVKFAKEWYPFAEAQGRQVVMNNRCGALPQFDTPEYARFSSIQRVKWETSEGIDPYTYGYNRRTKAEDYRSVQTIVSTLVDIVSKNGNYLLNVGPTAEGEIIKPMIDRLLEVGKWLAYSGECIYGTTGASLTGDRVCYQDYSFLGAESGDVRFTTTAESFCMISLVRPENGLLVIERAVPVLPGDEISLLGGGEEGKRLEWWIKDGKLVVRVAEEVLDRVEWAWAFKVSFLVR